MNHILENNKQQESRNLQKCPLQNLTAYFLKMPSFQEDLKIILNFFIFAGIPFFEKSKSNTKRVIINTIMTIALEIIINMFGLYTLVISFFYNPFNSIIAKLMALFVNVSIISLRFLFSFDRSRILRLMDRIQCFLTSHRGYYKTVKNYVLLFCCLSISMPTAANMFYSFQIVKNYDRYRQDYHMYIFNITFMNELSRMYLILFLQIVFMIHFFVVPSLCMILLSFIYFIYGEILQRTMLDIRKKLKVSSQEKTIKMCIQILQDVLEIHQEIENVFSFKTFLAYILWLVNFFHLVCIMKFRLTDNKPEFIVHVILVFSWTLIWFGGLILAGAKVADENIFNHHFRRKIILYSLNTGKCQQRSLLHLLMFLDCTKTEINFTVWGMLKLNKELLFTTVGVIISYSVLIATI